jgi:hypothetical protein
MGIGQTLTGVRLSVLNMQVLTPPRQKYSDTLPGLVNITYPIVLSGWCYHQVTLGYELQTVQATLPSSSRTLHVNTLGRPAKAACREWHI